MLVGVPADRDFPGVLQRVMRRAQEAQIGSGPSKRPRTRTVHNVMEMAPVVAAPRNRAPTAVPVSNRGPCVAFTFVIGEPLLPLPLDAQFAFGMREGGVINSHDQPAICGLQSITPLTVYPPVPGGAARRRPSPGQWL
jgi:hypothetical protein